MIHCVVVSLATREELLEVIKSDTTMPVLRKIILNGWPACRGDLPTPEFDYFNFREMSIRRHYTFKGERSIVPSGFCESEGIEQQEPH